MRATYASSNAVTVLAALFVVQLFAPRPVAGQGYIEPLDPPRVDSVRALLTAMKADERGPYLRIRWFCNDGSVHPPQGQPCKERGGGNQHAELKPEARRLGKMGIHVGTILQGLDFSDFLDAEHENDRLRQLVLEDYLVQVDEGWVLRRARFYRGARQAEDEERAGTELLERLLSDGAWTAENYWLANQVVAVVPHVGLQGDQLVHRIRNLASAVAELEPSFLPLRVRIHSFPSPSDLADVNRWRQRSNLSAQVRARLDELHAALAEYYDASARLENLATVRRRLAEDTAVAARIDRLRESLSDGPSERGLRALAELSATIRRQVAVSGSGRKNLRLMDLNLALQEHAVRLGTGLADVRVDATRRQHLRDLLPFIDLAYGAGFLSSREGNALRTEAVALAGEGTVGALEYRERVAYLARGLDWSMRTVRSAMYPTLERYEAVEPRAAGFPDAATRGSVLLPMARGLGAIVADADSVLGTSHAVLGEPVRTGVRGLNPGLALGELRSASSEDLEHLERDAIYLLPETVSELRPVAGVLSMDAGNLLSHVQLLARNLGIPNASVSSAVAERLEGATGRPVLFAVSPLGRVVVQDTTRLDPELRGLVDTPGPAVTRILLDGSGLALDSVRPVSMDALRSSHSGVLVGPKAANLGQLASVFPTRVAPGVALPFGMFARHVDREWQGARPLETLRAARDSVSRMRAGGRSEDEIDAYMFEALALVRSAITELPWAPGMRADIARAVETAFGADLSAGIFVRSDTNVEDLPQFSGAGLNLTVPNQRTVDDILVSIKRVWTSPFSERAYLWRKQILDERSAVYPSVLLLRTVPSERSGVLITSGLQFGEPGDLTIATAEGIGGAVDGEDAETIIVRPDGEIRLLSQSKAPRKRILREGGGVEWVPASRPDTLLRRSEIDQLRRIVTRWTERTPDRTDDRVWDMEFGVVDGKVWLFQVRPFIRFRSSQLLDRLSPLDREMTRNSNRMLSLEETM